MLRKQLTCTNLHKMHDEAYMNTCKPLFKSLLPSLNGTEFLNCLNYPPPPNHFLHVNQLVQWNLMSNKLAGVIYLDVETLHVHKCS